MVAIVVTLAVLVTRGAENEAGANSTLDTSSASTTSATAPTTTTLGATSTTYSVSTSVGAGSSTSLAAAQNTTTSRSSSTTSSSTTSSLPTTTSVRSTTSSTVGHVGVFVVVIDPGHQAKGDSSGEPIGPGSSQTKAKVSSGTAGVVTGAPESQLVLTVSLKLRDLLVAEGIKVVMTRTTENVNLSNIQRAQIANEAHADLFVRIHADGSTDHSVAGIHVLYPVSIKGWTDDIAEASKRAATLAQKDLIAATGAKDRGIDARSDMTGFNWSDVPVILPEIGFMTNSAEDRLLATAAYQEKIVQGLNKAILSFLGVG